MDSLKYSLFVICALVLILCVKEYEGRFAVFLRLSATISTCLVCASLFIPIYDYINSNISLMNVSSENQKIFTTMIKSTGISFIGCIASTICKDSGEASLAGAVENVCKLEIILLCLPIIDIIMEKIQSVM